ncbi:MAG TPA: type II secretion system F family protein [Caulobacteraceae bacterium]|nr:type II secretion system F family protein [Caulobacteraceae bacterium]
MDSDFITRILTPVALAMIAIGVGGVSFVGIRAAATASRRRARLAGGGAIVSGAADGGTVAEALQGVVSGVRRLGDRIAIQDPAQLSTLRQRLMQAGYYSREAAAIYLGAKATAMIAAIIGLVLLLPWAVSKHGGGGMAIIAGAVIALAAVMGPDQVVKNRRKQRELEYREGFPDMLDLLVASVEAGLSLDAAVNRVTDELVRRYPNLAEHLKVLTLELRAGRSRKEAWTAFAERLAIDEARSLATMLRQAEEMGTSLGETLAVFSDDMRSKRMLHAEEKAMALPAKMMLPLILFIFPCLIGVLMLPAAYRIKETLMK